MSCHVEIVGQGEPLVLLHGWGMNSAVWQRVVKPLSVHRRLYLVDLPGMGNSQTVSPYTLDRLAGAVAEVIPGVSDVLGWSLGGLVAQRIALDQPERVRRLILVGTSPCFVSKNNWEHGISAQHFQQFSAKFEQDFKATLFNFLTLQCMHAKDARATIKQLRTEFEAKSSPSQDALNQSLQILLNTDLRTEINLMRQPTLVIHGDRDTLAPVAGAHWLTSELNKAQLNQAKLRVIAGAAHAPFLSHADAFCDAVIEFTAVSHR